MIYSEHLELLKPLKTPFYNYNLSVLADTLKACTDEANKYKFHVHYALKANSDTKVVKLIAAAGLGADCVSGNEVKFAIANGFSPQNTVFAGVGKSDEEINAALDLGILCFNCESIEELEIINELAAARNKVAQVALRINPNVNAYTHHYITTGLDENKFGINRQQLPAIVSALKNWPNVKVIGIHFHIGSQITNLDVFKNLCTRVNEFTAWFEDHDLTIPIINVGGGLGIDYDNPEKNFIPNFAAYFEIFNRFLIRRTYQEVHFELGRALVAQCGDLISRVLYVKKGLKTNFVILDAGMTELMRPALYQAKHKLVNLSTNNPANLLYDVVGPVCESSDSFGKAVDLAEVHRGDLFAIRSAGAYGEVMASRYNLRELNPSAYIG